MGISYTLDFHSSLLSCFLAITKMLIVMIFCFFFHDKIAYKCWNFFLLSIINLLIVCFYVLSFTVFLYFYRYLFYPSTTTFSFLRHFSSTNGTIAVRGKLKCLFVSDILDIYRRRNLDRRAALDDLQGRIGLTIHSTIAWNLEHRNPHSIGIP